MNPIPRPLRAGAMLSLALLLPVAQAWADARTIDVRVTGGHADGGVKVVRLVRDDEVVLRVTADKDDELHLHGYNLRAQVKPDVPAVLRFVATKTGRFGAELHGAGADVVVFEIYPR